jgi:hypothetical protein
MTTAIAAFLQFYSDSTVHGSWQNFFVDKTVSGYAFTSFDVSEIMLNRSADEGGVTVSMAATDNHLGFLETAISSEYLARITLYEMPVSSSLPTDLSNATIVARFVGEVMGMQTDLVTIQAEIGAAIDAISGEIPGRKITTSLVGRLPTL